MNSWILIITLFGPLQESSVAIASVEFTNQQRCEAAMIEVLAHRPDGTSKGNLPRSLTMMEAVCVEK